MILSWVSADPYNEIVRTIYMITDFILVPLKRYIPLQIGMFDLSLVFAQLEDFYHYWWLYAMVFSTIVPTGLHAAVAASSLQGIIPISFRHRIVKWIDERESNAYAAMIAPLALA